MDSSTDIRERPSSPNLKPAPPSRGADRILLEGPHSRSRELRLVLTSVRDFIRGFRTLHFAGPCVTVCAATLAPRG